MRERELNVRGRGDKIGGVFCIDSQHSITNELGIRNLGGINSWTISRKIS